MTDKNKASKLSCIPRKRFKWNFTFALNILEEVFDVQNQSLVVVIKYAIDFNKKNRLLISSYVRIVVVFA